MGKWKELQWTSEEIATLKELYPEHTISELTAILLGRSWCAIQHKARKLRLRRSINRDIINKRISAAKKGKPGHWKGKKFAYKRSIDLNPYVRTPEIKAKLSATIKKQFQQGRVTWCKGKRGIFSQETLDKIRQARQKQQMPHHNTKPEHQFIEICEKHNLPFKYVGDGQIWIGGINPDFVECNGKKIAVDIFGDYWHTPLFRQSAIHESYTETGRTTILKQYGWKLIVIWQSELKLADAEGRILSKLRKAGIKI